MAQNPSPFVLVIAGPTASGKTRLALAVAEACGGAVINADSMQVYRELPILTARPSAAEQARVPHRLFGVLSVMERCSAGRWLAMAADAIAEVRAMGRLPIVTGGTGLYLKALVDGLSPVPPVPDAIRAEAEDLWQRLGPAGFRATLAALDPAARDQPGPSDRQRLVRSYAVLRATGRSLRQWHRERGGDSAVPGPFRWLVLDPPREALYRAIDRRFEAMLAAGAMDEVRAFLALAPDPGLPAWKAVGVREIAAVLNGRWTLAEATAAAQQASRRYAKRQLTWLRHQVAGAHVVQAQLSESFDCEILPFIRRFLLTP